MNLHFVRSSFILPLALATHARAADAPAVPITVQLGGQTYVGTVAPQAAASQPATSQPSTRVATGAGVEAADDAVTTLRGGPVPLAVHVDAMDVLDPAALGNVRVTWNFGDAAGARNELAGYNAAHAYDAPGTYAITRTVTTPAGSTERAYRVTVTPDVRRPIHVSADGNDAADGTTPERAVRTWNRAAALVRVNSAVLLRRGDRFPVDRTFQVKVNDVRFAPYGDAALPAPTLALSVPHNDFPMINARGERCVVEGITFDSDVVGEGLDKKNVADSIQAGGRGLLVRGCTFRAVCNAINGNGEPEGVLVEGNDAPLETGVRAYFTWIQGGGWTLLDNTAANSTREHIARAGGAERLNITGNRFANLDRREPARGGDAGDFSKATINVQKGRVAWIAQNVLTSGPLSCGPLGGGDGKGQPEGRWIGATFEDNRIVNAGVEIQHGAVGLTYRNNLVEVSGRPAFSVYDYNAEYGRGCVDVTLANNTAVNVGEIGNFVRIGAGAVGVRLIRNAYVAPKLVTGPYVSGPVYVSDATTAALTAVEGNRWGTPARAAGEAAKVGPFLIGGRYTALAQWQQTAATDKVLPLPEGTLAVDGAGVDASRLPAP